MNKLLLHLCCANCGLVPIEILRHQFQITLFWFNPNIQPLEEYQKRLASARELAQIYQLPLIVNQNNAQSWTKAVQGLEKEPEGGKRCEICFNLRLETTAQEAQKNKFDFFATTLGISLYKDTELINRLGKNLANAYRLLYYPFNVEKKVAGKKELELSKKYNFYRQKYCGCLLAKK